ncbi:hypothetical protein D3C77_303890 [compost metagenome]
MLVPRLSALLGGLLLSRTGRGFAGRHAGKIALATLAWQWWRRRGGGAHAAPRPEAAPPRRRRWSGRRR